MMGRINLSRWHVLIVDDDKPSAMVQADMLRFFKANTYVALSGVSALSKVTTLPQLTVIITDIKMLDMSGFQLLEHFRSIPLVASVPIVAVTACAMLGEREGILAAGFDGYIAKPVCFDTFWSELGEFIVQKRSA